MFVPDGPLVEGLPEFFHGVERGLNTAIAPELLMAEAANVILKKSQNGELNPDEARQLMSDILTMPIRLFRHSPLILRSMELASQHNLTVYDGLFVALAVQHSAILFSADERMLKTITTLGLVPQFKV
jgi:predicted nucleic acid-binding protein